MFTAKMLPNGLLKTTHHLTVPVVNEETGEVTYVDPTVPEGEVEVTLPQDEISLHFRDCWKLEAGAVVVDLEKAKAQRAAFIVQLVDARLAAIDAKTARATRDAITTGDNSRVQQLETEAAGLRAVRANPGVDYLTTVEEVAAYLPEVLA